MRIELILTPAEVLIIKKIFDSAAHDSEFIMSSNRFKIMIEKNIKKFILA